MYGQCAKSNWRATFEKMAGNMDIGLLKKYVKEELSPEEMERVEALMQQDEDVRETVEDLRMAAEMYGRGEFEQAAAEGVQAVREGFNAFLDAEEAAEPEPAETPVKTLNTGWWRYAAAILLVAALGYLIVQNSGGQNNESLIDAYLAEQDPLGLGNRGGIDSPEWVVLFEEGAYAEVLTSLGKIAELSDTQLIYKAIAQANTEALAAAIETLKSIAEQSPVIEVARYYQAICLWKNGGQAEATALFEAIVANRTYGYEKIEVLSY